MNMGIKVNTRKERKYERTLIYIKIKIEAKNPNNGPANPKIW